MLKILQMFKTKQISGGYLISNTLTIERIFFYLKQEL